MAVRHKQHKKLLISGTYAAGILLTLTAQGAEPADTAKSAAPGAAPATELEEVTVTAEKKVENIQQVPVSVAAFNSRQVEETESTNLEGLQGSVPDVQIGNFSNTPNSAVFNIRGLGVIEPDPYAGNTVTVVMDGVPQYFNMVSLGDLFGIERIDILRGPQGTLFGANTTGGVVDIATKQPTGVYGGELRGTFGNYDRVDIDGSVDFPIVAGLLAGKLDFTHAGSDGYVKNVVNGQSMGDENKNSIRGYLKYTPGDGFDATLILEYDQGRNGAPIVVNGAVPGEALYVPAGTVVNGSGPQYPSPCLPAGQPCHAPNDYLAANSSVPDTSDLNAYVATLTMNWDSPIGKLVSITGYKNFDLTEYTDQDSTVEFFDATYRPTRAWQFSQEVRDTIHPFDNFELLIGGFAIVDHYDLDQDYEIQFAAPGLTQRTLEDQNNWSGSMFVQSYWDITPSLRLQAGMRATYEWTDMRSQVNYFFNPSGIATFSGGIQTSAFEVEDSHSWDNLGGKIGLNWQVTDDFMAYGYYAHGFKSGGFVGRVALATDIGPYAPEYTDTIEAGIKSDWLQKHLRVNLAVFNTWYTDEQIAEIYFIKNPFGQTVNGNSILNAAASDIPGAELEVQAIPVNGLTLNGSLAYLHARYTNFNFNNATTPGATLDLSGYPLQNAPDWTASVGFSYVVPVGPGATVLGLQYNYTGKKYLEAITDTPRSEIQPTNYINSTLEWTPDDGNWSVELWCRNCANNHYIASVYDAPGVFGLVAYAPPLMYGVTAKYTFGGGAASPEPAAPAPIAAVAPPPPPEAAAPEAARSFQVFFDFDKSDITAAAAKVIQAAADAVGQGHVVQLTVTGHTDTVGSAVYNQGLSERRAASVKGQLVADGVAAGEISTIGVGKTGLLVPTADGVREPQNRRAEIVLQ